MERYQPEPTASVPRRRGRPKTVQAGERRSAILAAAYSAFLDLGFAGTTTAIVATRAKSSKRAIYELFANKTELLAAVIAEHRHLVLALPRPPGETGTAFEILVRIFRLDIDSEAARERDAVLNLIMRESVLLPELSTYLYEHRIIRFREDLIDWLNGEVKAGRLHIENEQVCAGMLMDIVFGALLPRRQLQTAGERALRIIHIKARLQIFLRGIAAG